MIDKKGKWKQIPTVLFYLALMIELAIVIIDKSAYINPIEGRLFQITFLLCTLKVCSTKYSFKEWLLLSFMCVIGIISYINTDRNEIIRVVMFVAASKNINLKNAMKVTFYTTLIGVVGLIILSLMGVLGTIAITTDYGRGYENVLVETRYCLGLGHPNALHCMLWMVMLLGIYLYFEQMKRYVFVLLFIGNIALYMLTTSRTGVIIATFTLVIASLLKYGKNIRYNKWFYVCGNLLFAVCILFALATARWGHSGGPFGWLDYYINMRIRFSHLVGGTHAWSLFSNPASTAYFDMGFMRLFYWYGIIPGALYVIMNILQLKYYTKKKDCMAFLMLLALTIYTIVEAHTISVYIARNYALLLLIGNWSEIFAVCDTKECYAWQIPMKLKRTISCI